MKKPQPKPKKDQKDQKALVYFITMLTFLGLSLGTEFHEVLHQFFAYINGWGITESVAGLTTGSTTAILEASKSATTWSIWWFYMFPSTAIFVGAFLINIIKPSRFIRVLGIVVMALNLASFDPGNVGSDAYKAAQLLIVKNWTLPVAVVALIIVAILFVIIYTIVTLVTSIEKQPAILFAVFFSLIIVVILKMLGIAFAMGTETSAYLIQYIIAIIFIAIYGIYLYVVIENSDRDTVNRAKRIL